MLADGNAKGRADPAFPAHSMPIGAWAAAVWERMLPMDALERMIESAKGRVLSTVRPWSVCYGPAAAFVATCGRLKWRVINAFKVVTDLGREIDMILDPPKAVVLEVDEAVRRWRWRRIVKYTEGGDAEVAGRGAFMEPIWWLLNPSKMTWSGTRRYVVH